MRKCSLCNYAELRSLRLQALKTDFRHPIETRRRSTLSCPGGRGIKKLPCPLADLETAWQPEREKCKVRLVK